MSDTSLEKVLDLKAGDLLIKYWPILAFLTPCSGFITFEIYLHLNYIAILLDSYLIMVFGIFNIILSSCIYFTYIFLLSYFLRKISNIKEKIKIRLILAFLEVFFLLFLIMFILLFIIEEGHEALFFATFIPTIYLILGLNNSIKLIFYFILTAFLFLFIDGNYLIFIFSWFLIVFLSTFFNVFDLKYKYQLLVELSNDILDSKRENKKLEKDISILKFISPHKESEYKVRNSRNKKRILKQEKRVYKLKKQLEKKMIPKKVCVFLTILVFISFISALLMNKNGIKLINFQKQYISYKIRGDETESIGLLIYQNDNGIYFNSYNRDKKEFWKDPVYIRKLDIRNIYYLPYPYEKDKSVYEYICSKLDIEYFCYFYNKNRKNTTPSV